MQAGIFAAIAVAIIRKEPSMATTYRPQDSIRSRDGNGFNLQVSDSLIVDRGIVISSADYDGIAGSGNNEIMIAGTVAGDQGIYGFDMTVKVLRYGLVSGENEAITSNASSHLQVTNSGMISSSYQGIAVYGTAKIENSGIIESGLTTINLNSAIYLGSTHGDTEIINTGTIEAKLANAYAILSGGGETTSDTVVNSGWIKGNVSLGGGDDAFTSTRGRVIGTIDGGAGRDKLTGTHFNDTLIGGTGNDRLAGNKGSDEFQFDIGAGQDVIIDFDAFGGGNRQDYLSLAQGMSYTEKSVHNGRDTLLTFADGQTITLLHVRAADFSNADIHFEI
jgi:Ca2+-binding RTX toxin-like protein